MGKQPDLDWCGGEPLEGALRALRRSLFEDGWCPECLHFLAENSECPGCGYDTESEFRSPDA